jgi:hypothetical protein
MQAYMYASDMVCPAARVGILVVVLSITTNGSSSGSWSDHRTDNNNTTIPVNHLPSAADGLAKSPDRLAVDQQVRSQRNARKEWSFKNTLHQIEARLGRVPTGGLSETTTTDDDDEYHQVVDSGKVRPTLTRYGVGNNDDDDADAPGKRHSSTSSGVRSGVGKRAPGSQPPAADEIILDAETGLRIYFTCQCAFSYHLVTG